MAQPARHYIDNKAQVNKNMEALKAVLDDLKTAKSSGKLTKGKIYELYARAVPYHVMTVDNGVPSFKASARNKFHRYNENQFSVTGLGTGIGVLVADADKAGRVYRTADEQTNLSPLEIQQLHEYAVNYVRLVYAVHAVMKIVVETPKG